MAFDKPTLILMAKATADRHGLDEALVCAVCEQESSWDTWASRFEPDFFTKYIAGPFLAGNLQPGSGKVSQTEAYQRAFSWGLMQVMGQVAREEGFLGPSLVELCDPAVGLDVGCKHLANIVRRVGDVSDAQTVALLHWNGGGNLDYPKEVLARIPSYES